MRNTKLKIDEKYFNDLEALNLFKELKSLLVQIEFK